MLSQDKPLAIFITAIIIALIPHSSSEQNINVLQCGGAIVSSGDTLSYPGPEGSIQERETCVWTIHLDTMKDFKFNFPEFSIGSNFTNCSDAGVRIYSLTNLVEPEQIQSHTFCKAKPPPENFFLSGNLAVLVFYINSPLSFEGTNFTVTWEGTTYDNLMTQHTSSLSTASSGSIRYPIVGAYEKNLVATWVVKSQKDHETLNSDVSLNALNLESCNNPNPCYCDALILYEITPAGILNETQRFCEDIQGASLQSLESQFIVAFYSDFNSESGPVESNGFDLVYYPSGIAASTTTTTEDPAETSTTSSEGPIVETCGGIIENNGFGTIAYNQTEGECYWMIRISSADSIQFDLDFNGISATYNTYIKLASFDKSVEPLREQHTLNSTAPDSITLKGNLAIVVFYGGIGEGFILRFKGVGESSVVISTQSRDLLVTQGTNGTLRHPQVEGQLYDQNEFSAFFLYPETWFLTQYRRTIYGLDTCCDCDFIQSYNFQTEYVKWAKSSRYCGGNAPGGFTSSRPMLFIFVSDYIHNYPGFEITWQEY